MTTTIGYDSLGGSETGHERYHLPDGETPVWTEASDERPCPLCGATHECKEMMGSEFAWCAHTVSQWLMAEGGWLHRLARRSDSSEPITPPLAATGVAKLHVSAGTRDVFLSSCFRTHL